MGIRMMEGKRIPNNQASQETLSHLFWRRFRKNKLALLGAFIVLFLFLVAVLASWISPYDPGQIQIKRVLEEPSAQHPFGTDSLGRDVLSRMIWGSRISLLV